MIVPRIQLAQTLWYLSRPWPHLDGWCELVVRAAFKFEYAGPNAPRKKMIEGCSAIALDARLDRAQLVATLDAAEVAGSALPLQAVIPWRAALGQSPVESIPARLLSWAAADAGLRIMGLPMAQGFSAVWEMQSSRQPEDPYAPWLLLESAPNAPDAGEPVLPGVFLQQQLALALARGDDTLSLPGPWAAALTHIPQRESDMMARMHGDLYLPGAQGPSIGGDADHAPDFVWVQTASVAEAVGLGYGQTIETHRRLGLGRLRGN